MIKGLLVTVATVIAIPVLLVVILMSPQTVIAREAGASVCVGMLGAPPTPAATIVSLGGPDALLVAQAAFPSGQLPVGEPAYQFVTTLNTITNWSSLPPADLAAWLLNPAAGPPAHAVIEEPWPAPEFTPEERDNLTATTPTTYDKACAILLRRVDAYAATESQSTPTTAATPTLPTVTTEPDRATLAASINSRIGAAMADRELWQLISPTPDLSPARTAFAQLIANPHPTVIAAPGDLDCFDFTTTGPTHCALIVTAAPHPQIATAAPDGILTATAIPLNSTVIRPTPIAASSGALP